MLDSVGFTIAKRYYYVYKYLLNRKMKDTFYGRSAPTKMCIEIATLFLQKKVKIGTNRMTGRKDVNKRIGRQIFTFYQQIVC